MSSAAPRRIDAAQVTGALLVEECDVPDGMTLAEWRSSCAAERRAAATAGRSGRARLVRALRRR